MLASCMDHPGVVHQFSAVLSQMGESIDLLETKILAEAMSGTPIFELDARISVPARQPT
jgi:glycine cleavage system regulatory protein